MNWPESYSKIYSGSNLKTINLYNLYNQYIEEMEIFW